MLKARAAVKSSDFTLRDDPWDLCFWEGGASEVAVTMGAGPGQQPPRRPCSPSNELVRLSRVPTQEAPLEHG